jgi:hypothetical protein
LIEENIFIPRTWMLLYQQDDLSGRYFSWRIDLEAMGFAKLVPVK